MCLSCQYGIYPRSPLYIGPAVFPQSPFQLPIKHTHFTSKQKWSAGKDEMKRGEKNEEEKNGRMEEVEAKEREV